MTDTENTITKRYSDSPEGVREMLAANFLCSLDIEAFEADPYVAGVWRVTEANGSCAIVFLAGYSDPSGRTRECNDAEFEDDYP